MLGVDTDSPPLVDIADGIRFWESLENMRITVPVRRRPAGRSGRAARTASAFHACMRIHPLELQSRHHCTATSRACMRACVAPPTRGCG